MTITLLPTDAMFQENMQNTNNRHDDINTLVDIHMTTDCIWEDVTINACTPAGITFCQFDYKTQKETEPLHIAAAHIAAVVIRA